MKLTSKNASGFTSLLELPLTQAVELLHFNDSSSLLEGIARSSVIAHKLGTFYSDSNLDRVNTEPGETDSSQPLVSDQEKITRQEGETQFIFDKISSKEIPSTVVNEDDKVLEFRDITPQGPVRILIIPKVRDGLTGLSKAEERYINIWGRLLYTAKFVAKQEGLDDGFRMVINDGPQGCQWVYSIHVHLIGGRQRNWSPG
ncbi:14 kDa zinc-binding protein-like [Raphanus sativus]|uniref:14 kDa zinc-binding protein-like n=1 Tax=Raphanus sativus TaxID=3726 RepID=A0A9W3CGQ7_RAPSA|nr:14 kDa zinc-binding protein-like [Raphanus sativus]